jgi:copper resistance protein C
VTVTHVARLACAVLLGLILLLIDAIPIAAHAELVSSDPADNADVEAPFDGPIVLTFDEALAPGSKADLKGPDGSTVGSATVDGDKLVFRPDQALGPGRYTIQWTSIGADSDVDRGILAFMVVAPPATATPPPAPTAPPAASASPIPSGSGTPATGSADVLFPLFAAVIALLALGAFLLNRNRRSPGR